MGQKLSVNKKFFQLWSSEMAYILGFWFADGSVERSVSMRGHYVRVGSTEFKVISYIKKQMSAKHKIHKSIRPLKKSYYLLRIGDKQLFNDLVFLGVVERKSNIMTFPNIPKKFIRYFILGYFDGDGCVYIEKNKDGSFKRLTTVFTSGSLVFLEQLRLVLSEQIGTSAVKKISETKSGSGAAAFQLRYSSHDSLNLYFYLYEMSKHPFCLRRKYSLFRKYIQSKNISINNLRHKNHLCGGKESFVEV